jgi:hypothetical protein
MRSIPVLNGCLSTIKSAWVVFIYSIVRLREAVQLNKLVATGSGPTKVTA